MLQPPAELYMLWTLTIRPVAALHAVTRVLGAARVSAPPGYDVYHPHAGSQRERAWCMGRQGGHEAIACFRSLLRKDFIL